jgi:hypothetical protein
MSVIYTTCAIAIHSIEAGGKNVAFNANCSLCTPLDDTFTQNVSANKHIFKLGVAAAPVIAKY